MENAPARNSELATLGSVRGSVKHGLWQLQSVGAAWLGDDAGGEPTGVA